MTLDGKINGCIFAIVACGLQEPLNIVVQYLDTHSVDQKIFLKARHIDAGQKEER